MDFLHVVSSNLQVLLGYGGLCRCFQVQAKIYLMLKNHSHCESGWLSTKNVCPLFVVPNNNVLFITSIVDYAMQLHLSSSTSFTTFSLKQVDTSCRKILFKYLILHTRDQNHATFECDYAVYLRCSFLNKVCWNCGKDSLKALWLFLVSPNYYYRNN